MAFTLILSEFLKFKSSLYASRGKSKQNQVYIFSSWGKKNQISLKMAHFIFWRFFFLLKFPLKNEILKEKVEINLCCKIVEGEAEIISKVRAAREITQGEKLILKTQHFCF